MNIVINFRVYVFNFYSDLDVLNDYFFFLIGGWFEFFQCYYFRIVVEDIRLVL